MKQPFWFRMNDENRISKLSENTFPARMFDVNSGTWCASIIVPPFIGICTFPVPRTLEFPCATCTLVADMCFSI